tara:strand:+ start:97 stop:420 length:324 start_codon:yes stop_codon:yes gene_type:complete
VSSDNRLIQDGIWQVKQETRLVGLDGDAKLFLVLDKERGRRKTHRAQYEVFETGIEASPPPIATERTFGRRGDGRTRGTRMSATERRHEFDQHHVQEHVEKVRLFVV